MAYTPWSGVTAAEIKTNVGTAYNTLGFASDEAYTTWITDQLIAECESHVSGHCKRTFSTEFATMTASDQNAIKGVIRRMVSNAIKAAVANRSGDIVNVADYKVDWPNREIFTDDLKDLLKPYVSNPPTIKATSYQTDTIKAEWDED